MMSVVEYPLDPGDPRFEGPDPYGVRNYARPRVVAGPLGAHASACDYAHGPLRPFDPSDGHADIRQARRDLDAMMDELLAAVGEPHWPVVVIDTHRAGQGPRK